MKGVVWLLMLVSLLGVDAESSTTEMASGPTGGMPTGPPPGNHTGMPPPEEEEEEDDDDDHEEGTMKPILGMPDMCCPMKMNDGKMYRLVSASRMAIMKYHCDSPCVYERMPMMPKTDMKRKRRRVKRDEEEEEHEDKKWYCFRMSPDGEDSKCAWFGYPPHMGSSTGYPGMASPGSEMPDMTTRPDPMTT